MLKVPIGQQPGLGAPPTNLILPPPIGPPLATQSALDLSKPPPNFGPLPPPGVAATNLMDKSLAELEVPYYNLPAGLMVPLVKMEQFDYKPLDHKLIKMPAPQPPTEKLLKAVDEFYAGITSTKGKNLYVYLFYFDECHNVIM